MCLTRNSGFLVPTLSSHSSTISLASLWLIPRDDPLSHSISLPFSLLLSQHSNFALFLLLVADVYVRRSRSAVDCLGIGLPFPDLKR